MTQLLSDLLFIELGVAILAALAFRWALPRNSPAKHAWWVAVCFAAPPVVTALQLADAPLAIELVFGIAAAILAVFFVASRLRGSHHQRSVADWVTIAASSGYAAVMTSVVIRAFRSVATTGGSLMLLGMTAGVVLSAMGEADRLQAQTVMAIDRCPTPVAFSDAVTQLTYVNPAFARLCGYQHSGDIRGRSLLEFCGQVDTASEVLRELWRDHAWSGELLARRKDGTNFTAGVSANVTVDSRGHRTGSSWTFTDLSQDVRAGREQIGLRTAIEYSSESVLVTDAEGRIQYCNPAFEKSSGYAQHELLGHTPTLLKSEKHGGLFYHEIWKTVGQGEVWRGDFVNRRKDGTLYEQQSTIAPLRDSAGRLTGFVSMNRDCSPAKSSEPESQKFESIGRLASGVAHDFNNLLTVIRGYSEMALMRGTRQGDSASVEVLGILTAVDNATELTRQLLVASCRQAGAPHSIDPSKLVANYISMLRQLVGDGVTLTSVLDPSPGLIRIAPVQFQQLLLNLVANARDALPGGGVVSIETGTAFLDETYAAQYPGLTPGPHTVLAVRDSGAGMDQDTLQHIFEPFFTTKEGGKGTGLGLSIVHGILQECGGHIRVVSASGAGSTFKLYFPTLAAEPDTLSVTPSGFSVLVVDDEPGVRAFLAQTLAAAGYRVAEARDGIGALQQARVKEFDLVLIDIVMPEKDGLETIRELRATNGKQKMIAMSGASCETYLRAAQVLGADAVLRKPLEAAELLRLAGQLTEGARGSAG